VAWFVTTGIQRRGQGPPCAAAVENANRKFDAPTGHRAKRALDHPARLAAPAAGARPAVAGSKRRSRNCPLRTC